MEMEEYCTRHGLCLDLKQTSSVMLLYPLVVILNMGSNRGGLYFITRKDVGNTDSLALVFSYGYIKEETIQQWRKAVG